MALPKHDGITKVIFEQVDQGVKQIVAANEVLLKAETGTPIKDIDKALKAKDNNLPENIKSLAADAEKAFTVYKEAIDAARNTYRTEVLHEEAKADTSEVDADAVKEVRKVVMDALTFMKTYATSNGRTDWVEWANTIAVPQVGRQGTSSVGAKKPRVFVKIGESVFDSFTTAAVSLSTKDRKVTAGELAEAWNAAGGKDSFTFLDKMLLVTLKTKKSEEKAETPAA